MDGGHSFHRGRSITFKKNSFQIVPSQKSQLITIHTTELITHDLLNKLSGRWCWFVVTLRVIIQMRMATVRPRRPGNGISGCTKAKKNESQNVDFTAQLFCQIVPHTEALDTRMELLVPEKLLVTLEHSDGWVQ